MAPRRQTLLTLRFAGSKADIDVPHFNAPFRPITVVQRADVKSVRNISLIVLLLAALDVSGCAGTGAGLQTSGIYVLERNEQAADCQALHKSIWGRVQILKGLPAKARTEQQATPSTASSLFGRWFGGPNKGLAAVQEYDRERAHAYALQYTMVEKKCVAVDLDRELADVAVEMTRIRAN